MFLQMTAIMTHYDYFLLWCNICTKFMTLIKNWQTWIAHQTKNRKQKRTVFHKHWKPVASLQTMLHSLVTTCNTNFGGINLSGNKKFPCFQIRIREITSCCWFSSTQPPQVYTAVRRYYVCGSITIKIYNYFLYIQ